MNIKYHARRSIAAATLVASVAVAIGAAGAARADNGIPTEPVATETPVGAVADESPPDTTADASPPTTGDDAVSSTSSTLPADPTTTTTPPAAITTTTTVPATSTTTPPAAIATTTIAPATTAPTTTAPPNNAVNIIAASLATAPQSPVATPGNASVKLTWLAPLSNGGAAIDKYVVQRLINGQWQSIATPTTLSYSAGGLTNGTKYYFRIAAHSAAGWGPVSTTVSAIPRTVPTAPQSPTATRGNASVTLTWLKPSNGGAAIDKYAVQWYNPVKAAWENVAFPTTLSYTKSGLLNGTKYSFRILAHNAAGWGPASAVVSAVPRTVPGAPFAVQATPSDNYVGLTWSAPPNGGAPIDKYRVQLATSLAGPWTTYVGQFGPITSSGFGYPEVQNGTTYHFRVAAHNAAGWGPYSSPISAVPRTVPSAPGLTANPMSATQVSLTVQRPANGGAPIDLYRVEMRTGAGGQWTLWYSLAANNNVASFNVDVKNLSPGTMYYFRVYAHNAAGWGPYSTEVSAKTPPTTPSAPTACSAVETSYNMVYIDWNAPAIDGGSPIINYHIRIEKGEYKYQYVGSGGYWYWDHEAFVIDEDTVGPFTDDYELLSSGDYLVDVWARNSVGLGLSCEAEVHIGP